MLASYTYLLWQVKNTNLQNDVRLTLKNYVDLISCSIKATSTRKPFPVLLLIKLSMVRLTVVPIRKSPWAIFV